MIPCGLQIKPNVAESDVFTRDMLNCQKLVYSNCTVCNNIVTDAQIRDLGL
jgi:hypothetical protein